MAHPETDRTRVAMVRHGQTDWNLAGRIQGATDVPLNRTGIEQAHATAESLRGQDWGLMLASPLERARVTAEIIAAELGLDAPVLIPELHERAFGPLEGLTPDERQQRFQDRRDLDGVETTGQVADRAQPAIDREVRRHPGAHVLVVAHGGVIGSLLLRVTQGRLPRPEDVIPNGAVNEFGIDAQGGWSLLAYAARPSDLYRAMP